MIGGRERLYLGVFIGTIGKFVPLVSEEALSAALKERQRMPQAMAAAVGAERIACEQAQVGLVGLRLRTMLTVRESLDGSFHARGLARLKFCRVYTSDIHGSVPYHVI